MKNVELRPFPTFDELLDSIYANLKQEGHRREWKEGFSKEQGMWSKYGQVFLELKVRIEPIKPMPEWVTQMKYDK